MIIAAWLSPVTGSGTGADPYRSQISDDYAVPTEDITIYTEAPPDPKTMTVVTRTDQATFDIIDADNTYFNVWSYEA